MDTQTTRPGPAESERKTCSPPPDIRREVEHYDRLARVHRWDGPRYRMTIRELGEGPPLILVPGVASTYRGYAMTLNRLAGRFRTICFDYPGDNPDDNARLREISHSHLVDDVFGLIDHLNLGRVFLFGLSFGSTVTLETLRREPRRFPKAVIQGGFARRAFSVPEKVALWYGRRLKGNVSRLPWHERILHYNNYSHFPDVIADRWPFYVEQNGLTPIAGLSHRLGLLSRIDLRPVLKEIPVEILLIQGNEDRIVPRACLDELKAGLPRAESVVVPIMGHQPHYTHAEVLAKMIDQFLLPCAPEACPNHQEGDPPHDGSTRSTCSHQ